MKNKKELVFKVLRNEPAERVPVGFWHHYLEDEHVNAIEHEGFYEENIAGVKSFSKEFDPDFVKVMTDGYFDLPIDLDISSAKTLLNFATIPFSNPWFQKQLRLLAENRRIYGDDIAMFYNVFAPLWHLEAAVRRAANTDDEGAHAVILRFLQEDPEIVASVLDRIADNLRPLIQAVLAPGNADGIYFSAQDMHRYIPDAIYRLYVTPSEKKALEFANAISEYNMIHICGWRGNTNYLSIYQDYPVTAFNWAVNTEGLSLREGKKFFGGRCVIGGFLNTEESLLFRGTKEEIQAYTRKLLDETGRTGVIIGADCTLPRSIDYEKLKWVREAAAKPSGKIHV